MRFSFPTTANICHNVKASGATFNFDAASPFFRKINRFFGSCKVCGYDRSKAHLKNTCGRKGELNYYDKLEEN